MNTWTIMIAIFSLAALVLLAALFRRSRRPADWQALVAGLQPLDVLAFRNLLSPGEVAFLRARLAPHAFRNWHAEQRRAVRRYARALAANAGLLTQLGEIATRSQEAAVAAAGANLMQTAVRARIFAFGLQARTVLGARSASPSRVAEILDSYQNAVSMAARLSLPG